VSEAGARAYGVVADAEGRVDAAATSALRAELAAAQPAETAIFNRGGTVDELRAACEAETGLPAPRQPVWHHLAIAAE
jgi:N-methylhydantoinase B